MVTSLWAVVLTPPCWLVVIDQALLSLVSQSLELWGYCPAVVTFSSVTSRTEDIVNHYAAAQVLVGEHRPGVM